MTVEQKDLLLKVDYLLNCGFFFQNVICCFCFFLLFCLVLCFSMWVSCIDAK